MSQFKTKPTVLIATTCRWFPTARLALALANAGCTVEAVCPSSHPIGKTHAVRQTHTYHGLTPVKSFADAIAATQPDLIVPGDDRATMHLHDLYNRERNRGEAGASICALIESSLGSSASFPVVLARTAFLELAQEEGIRVPKSQVIHTASDLRDWVTRMGCPTVLKTDRSSGGEGVRIVQTLEEAERAFRSLEAPPLLARAAKRALIDQDTTLMWPSLLRRRSIVNAQAFVAGREATSLIACWKGAVLASLHFEVLNKEDAGGPSTVLRLTENTEMSVAAEKMIRRLDLSGLHGFDFMLEAHTGSAYLLEINPRATQIGHLTLGSGRDLPAALYAAVSGEVVQPCAKLTENDTIALFPQEWKRNPKSAFLQSGYHDVPWKEPELVRACLRGPRNHRARISERDLIQAFAAAHLPGSGNFLRSMSADQLNCEKEYL
jgi:hypothetical protein